MASQLTARTEKEGHRPGILGTIRFGVRVLGMAISLAICLPLHGLWRLFRQPSPWPRVFLALVARCCGYKTKTVGERVKTDVFFVSNHLSWSDIPVVAGVTGCAFVSKDEAENVPLIGWLCKLNHTVFVSRTDRMSVANQIDILREALDENQPITVFPEGTTTDGQNLLPFKPSLFAVVAPPPKPMLVQPLLLDFGAVAAEIAWVGEETALHNAWRLLSRKGSINATVHFLEPYDPDELANRKEIAAHARERIRTALSASLGGVAIV